MRLDAVGDRPPDRRAVAEEHGRGRHRRRVRQAEVARPAQGGAAGPAADVAAGQHQHAPRGLRLLRPALRAATAGSSNLARFKLPEYDRLYDGRARCPTAPERQKLIAADERPRRRLRAVDAARVTASTTSSSSRGCSATSSTPTAASVGVPRHRHRALQWRGRSRRLTAATRPARRGRQRVRWRAGARRRLRWPGAGAPAPAPAQRRLGRPGEGAARRVPVAETGLRPAGDVATTTRPTSSRAIFDSLYQLRLPRAAVQDGAEHRRGAAARSPPTAARGRSACGRASTSPTIRRSRASAARADRAGLRLRAGSACSTRGCARRACGCSTAGSPAPSRCWRQAKQDGRLDYDAPIAGPARVDRYTLRIELVEPDYMLLALPDARGMAAVAREVVEAHGDASNWAMANPVGTGPVPAEGMAARPAHRAGGEPGLPRRPLPAPRRRRRPTRRSLARMKGRRLPLVGRVEVSDHRGGAAAAARVPRAASSTTSNVPPRSRGNVLDAGNGC